MYKKRIYISFLISYLLIFLIPIVLSVYTQITMTKSLEETVCNSTKSMLEHCSDIMDKNFQEINNIAMSISNDKNIYFLAYQDSPLKSTQNLNKVNDARKFLSNRQYESFLSEYYLYLNRCDMVIGSQHSYLDFESFADFFSYRGMETAELKQYLNKSHGAEFLPSAATFFSSAQKECILYTMSYPLDTLNLGTLVFPIETKSISHIISSDVIGEYGWAYVTDPKGETLLSVESSDGEFMEVDTKRILPETNSFVDTMDGEKVLVVSTVSSYNGLRYVAVIPYQDLIHSVKDIRAQTIYALIVALIVGFGFIIFVAWRKSKPLNDTLDLILAQNKGILPKVGSGASYITESVSQLISSNHTLQDKIELQKPMIKRLMIEKLLTGSNSDQENFEISLNNYGIDFKDRILCVIVVSVDGSDERLECAAIEEMMVLNQLVDTQLDILTKDAHYSSDISLNRMGYILTFALPEEQAHQELEKVVCSLSESIEETYHIRILISVGNLVEDYRNISRSYDQACDALSNRKAEGERILWYSRCDENKDSCFFPTTVEERLINSTKTGNLALTQGELRQIYNENIIKRNLNPIMISYLIHDLQCCILKSINAIKEVASPDLTDIYSKMEHLDSGIGVLEKFQHINQIFDELCKLVSDSKSKKFSQLMQDAAAYVVQNYSDPMLSLTKISEKYGYASAYFSKIFKDYTGDNFTSYLEKLRVEHVCELLKTDMTLEKIAIESGYNSAYVLRNAFKRVMGMTPNDYRKTMDT